jgi:hypothetical protein
MIVHIRFAPEADKMSGASLRPLSAKRFTSHCQEKQHSATEAYQSKTVRHGPNCSRETIANLAARMLKRHVDPHPLFRASKSLLPWFAA